MKNNSAHLSKANRRLGFLVHGGAPRPHVKTSKPGQHGSNLSGQSSVYGTQLKAKSALQMHHGMTAKQLYNQFKIAKAAKGNLEENFVHRLNSRLDINVFRAGFASTFSAAMQLVGHGFVKVNNKKVDIRSYLLKAGDVISLNDKALRIPYVEKAINNKTYEVPQYLKPLQNNKVEFIQAPGINTAGYPFKVAIGSIIGYFSR